MSWQPLHVSSDYKIAGGFAPTHGPLLTWSSEVKASAAWRFHAVGAIAATLSPFGRCSSAVSPVPEGARSEDRN